MILEVDSIELYFKNKPILNGVYLKGETGKITGLLGRNGSGKSCLLRIIFGDLKPKYKLIRLNNKPILKPLFTTKKVNYLPQYNFITKSLRLKTVFQLFKVNWFDFLIDFENFSRYNKTKFGNLSGGEKRIIEIYLILKTPGQIILLDEPFNGVVPIHITKINNLINREKKHKIIILTDHRYNELIDVCDNLYLVKNGCTKLIDNLKELEVYKYLPKSALLTP